MKRSHLLDAREDGGLILELYSRDGVGTMISADFYEGGWLGTSSLWQASSPCAFTCMQRDPSRCRAWPSSLLPA